MRSVVDKAFAQIRETGTVKLFKSYRPEFRDGEQRRDFIYVKDAVDMTLYLAESGSGGLFNVGSGRAQTWLELVRPIFRALRVPERIEFVEMPDHLRGKYQYSTCATVDRLRAAGYDRPVTRWPTRSTITSSTICCPDASSSRATRRSPHFCTHQRKRNYATTHPCRPPPRPTGRRRSAPAPRPHDDRLHRRRRSRARRDPHFRLHELAAESSQARRLRDADSRRQPRRKTDPARRRPTGTIGKQYFTSKIPDAPKGGMGLPVDGIACGGMEYATLHIHPHLSIFINGKQIAIPQGIGFGLGSAQNPQGCLYWIHTHDSSGIIHIEAPQIEAPVGGPYTLGMLFDIWGQPLTDSNVAGAKGPVTAFVNGTKYDGDLRAIPLNSHQEIMLEVGTTGGAAAVIHVPAERLGFGGRLVGRHAPTSGEGLLAMQRPVLSAGLFRLRWLASS